MTHFPVLRASALSDQAEEKRWLVEGLWAEQAVGIIGGEPKCCKSYLALTLAVAVASGKPCLGRFPVSSHGSVLLFPAEDALPIVKRRLDGICKAQNLSLSNLPLYVITTSVLRLDVKADRDRLRETIKKIRPSLLILDPFVRMHSIDENASSEVAKILHHLRNIQRSFDCAVALVHHAKKGGNKHRAGQALRGSSEFHAWGDSNLYLRRDRAEKISLTIEHRAESSPDPIPLVLNTDNSPHLQICDNSKQNHPLCSEPNPQDLVLQTLLATGTPMRLTKLRKLLPLRNETVAHALQKLVNGGAVIQTSEGYCATTS